MLHTKKRLTLAVAVATVAIGCVSARLMNTAQRPDALSQHGLRIEQDERAGTLSVYRGSQPAPVLVQNARPDARPYLHPIAAPDGHGVLTEYRPAHHPHQTGLYWGFTRVNGGRIGNLCGLIDLMR